VGSLEGVKVWGDPYTGEVYQKSKSVWIATGEYMGEVHSTQGRSATSAAATWQEWARYKGNG
jgi:hypothetical protein